MDKYVIVRDDRDYAEFFETEEEANRTALQYAEEECGVYFVARIIAETSKKVEVTFKLRSVE